MGIAVLGPLQVEGGAGALAPRDRVVLSVLAMHVGDLVSADLLAEALWGDSPPATWNKALQGTVVRLRKVLGAPAIQTVGHSYRLTIPGSDIDCREYERLVGRARELLGLGEPDRAAYVLQEALALWRGRPWADLEDWVPGRAEADRLEELRRDADELRIDAALRSGRHREVLSDARALVEQAPLREQRWTLLALAQYRSGQQADALRTLHQLRRLLVSELGLDPGADVLALEQAILRQDPELLPGVTVLDPSDTCPYLGLVPYDVADADAFFGRESDIAACRRRLADSGTVAVVGPSGSGKSSLVRAGLAAALQRDGDRVTVITPGAHPMAALSRVPSRGRPGVLVVDQTEEAVALCEDPAELAEFFDALARHAGSGRLVVALRADRFGDLAAHAAFARLVEQALYVLTPMSADSLREAIEGPARQAALRLEPGLVELLIAEVEGQPGVLPYLSHALRQTWERREGGVLTLEGYRETGGIRDAVAQSAERVHDDLPTDQRILLRDLMLRLVTPGPDGEPVRGRIPRRQLTVDDAHDRVMERLVTARLVTSDDGVVELAHEALARAWPRLQGWLDDDTEGQRILRHLSVAADTWQTMGRPDDELYRGTRLAQALEWRARGVSDITPVEAGFLAAGDRRARQEEASAQAQASHQARVNRRLRGLLVGASLLLVVAVVTSTLAVRQANRAAEATETANARRVGAQAQLAANVDTSLALAAAASAVDPSTESRAGLLAALSRSPQLAAVRPIPGNWVEVSPADGTVVTMGGDHQVRFHDPRTYELTGEYDPYPDRTLVGIGGNLAPLAFSSDGSRLAMALMAVEEGIVRILDTSTRQPVDDQPGGQPKGAHTNDVELSRDGRYLAVSVSQFPVGNSDFVNPVYVWDLRRPQRPLQQIEMPSDTFHLEFSPDGRRIHAAPGWNSDAGPGLWTYSVRTGTLLESSSTGGQALESSPDGRTLAYGVDATAYLIDERTGAVLHRLRDPGSKVERLSFSQDGRLVAAVSDDPAVYVWEVATGRLVERITLPAEAEAVDFDRAGARVLVPSGGRLHVYDLTGSDRYVERLHTEDPDALPVLFRDRSASPYEPVVAISTYHPGRGVTTMVVADRPSEQIRRRLGLGWAVDSHDLAWSPDRRHLAVVDVRGWLRVHDWRSGDLVARRRLPGGQLSYTTDGSRLLASGEDGLVLLDARTLREVTEPVEMTEDVLLASVGPEDDTAVVVTAQKKSAAIDAWNVNAVDRWQLLDLPSGQPIRSGRLRESAQSMAVSTGPPRLAVAGFAGVEIVDLATGRSTHSPTGSRNVESEGWNLTYSPDGRLLASGDGTGRVSLWDGHSAALLGTVQPGDTYGPPLFVDDETLLLQYVDGASYVWDTSERHAVEVACRIMGHGLSREEWRTAFGDRPYIDVCA